MNIDLLQSICLLLLGAAYLLHIWWHSRNEQPYEIEINDLSRADREIYPLALRSKAEGFSKTSEWTVTRNGLEPDAPQ